MNTERIFLKDLNANDVFCIPGYHTQYVCEARKTEGNRTRVTYRVLGDPIRHDFHNVNLSTVDVVL